MILAQPTPYVIFPIFWEYIVTINKPVRTIAVKQTILVESPGSVIANFILINY